MKFKPISNTETNLEDRLIKIGETPIKQVSETKFLGIIIDDKLPWNPQIQYLRRKLSSSIGILNRIKDSIPIPLHKNLYHTLFKSHLCYGITSWGGVPESKLRPCLKSKKDVSAFFMETKKNIFINSRLFVEYDQLKNK